tara:strand:- start:779 stop:1228 length:450 start_codon:yes stop_codon:yes gene_type:complete
MKHLFLTLFILFLSFNSFSQDDVKIVTNDKIVHQLLEDFVDKVHLNGMDLQDTLFENVEFVIIALPGKEVDNYGRYNEDNKIIVLSHDIKIDAIILRTILYRELLHSVGVPYDDTLIMKRERPSGFSYSVFSEKDIMDVEFTRALTSIN